VVVISMLGLVARFKNLLPIRNTLGSAKDYVGHRTVARGEVHYMWLVRMETGGRCGEFLLFSEARKYLLIAEAKRQEFE
jgi:hypothetical protein